MRWPRVPLAVWLFPVVAWLAPVQALASYTYYVNEDAAVSGSFATNWSANGVMWHSCCTMWAPMGYTPGTLISTTAVPDGTSEYEIRATIGTVDSAATYALYTRATSDANLAGSGSGTFYAFEMRYPTFSNGICSANFNV